MYMSLELTPYCRPSASSSCLITCVPSASSSARTIAVAWLLAAAAAVAVAVAAAALEDAPLLSKYVTSSQYARTASPSSVGSTRARRSAFCPWSRPISLVHGCGVPEKPPRPPRPPRPPPRPPRLANADGFLGGSVASWMVRRRAGSRGYCSNRRRSSGASSRTWNGWTGVVVCAWASAAGAAVVHSSFFGSSGGWFSWCIREQATEQLSVSIKINNRLRNQRGEDVLLSQETARAFVFGGFRVADAAQRAPLGRGWCIVAVGKAIVCWRPFLCRSILRLWPFDTVVCLRSLCRLCSLFSPCRCRDLC